MSGKSDNEQQPGERIAKAIARAGLASRREAELRHKHAPALGENPEIPARVVALQTHLQQDFEQPIPLMASL